MPGGQRATVNKISWSPDGRAFSIETGGDYVHVHIWRIATGKLINLWKAAYSKAAAWSPDGRKFAAAPLHESIVNIWRARDGKLVGRVRGSKRRIYALTWSADAKKIATGSSDYAVEIFRVRDGRKVRVLKGHKQSVIGVAWSPNGRLIASAGWDKTIKLWRARNGRLARTLKESADIMRWSPRGRHIASIMLYHDQTLSVRRARDGKRVHVFKRHSRNANSLAWRPDGKVIAVGTEGGKVKLIRVVDGKLLRTLKAHTDRVRGLAWHPGGRIIVSSSWDKTMKFRRAGDGKLLATLLMSADGIGYVYTPDGRFEYSRPAGKKQIAFRVRGKVVRRADLHDKFHTPGLLRSILNR